MDTTKKKNLNRLTWIAQIGLLMGPFLTMMDANIVNVALDDISVKLNVSLTTIQWIVSGYLLALSTVIAATAFLAKRFGTLKVYLISMIGFTIGSILCALSNNFEMLLIARIIQGMFGAPMLPLAMDMLLGGNRKDKGKDLFDTVSPLMGILLFLAPAVGPTIGGLLIKLSDWHLIFWVNVPIGIIGLFAALRIPHTFYSKGSRDVKFDPLGLLFLSGGLALLTYGTSNIPIKGGFDIQTWPFWAGGGLLILIYGFWAYRRKHPAVNFKLLNNFNAVLSILICTIAAVIMFSILVLIPIFMGKIQGYSPLVVGLTLLPQGLITGLGTILGNKVPKKVGIRNTVVMGMLLILIGTMILQLMNYHISPWETAALLSVRGFAVGLIIQPLLVELIGSLPKEDSTDGNTMFNIAQRVGGAIGIAVLMAFLQAREQFHLDKIGIQMSNSGSKNFKISDLSAQLQTPIANEIVNGFHDTIWLLTGLSLLGLLLAFFLRKNKRLINNN